MEAQAEGRTVGTGKGATRKHGQLSHFQSADAQCEGLESQNLPLCSLRHALRRFKSPRGWAHFSRLKFDDNNNNNNDNQTSNTSNTTNTINTIENTATREAGAVAKLLDFGPSAV